MIKKVLVCLIVATGLWGCDGYDGGRRGECVTTTAFLNSDCLAEDIPNLCEPLECIAELMPGPFGDVPPDDPVIFTLPTEEGCDVQERVCQGIRCINNGLQWLLDFTINQDENLEGTIIVDIDRFSGTFVCIIN